MDMNLTPSQEQWRSLRLGLMLCYGINSFHDVEWSDGELPSASFDPQRLDPDAWCRAAQAAGMRFVLLTAKHHDGFTLWPSRHGTYGVQNSPFRGDVLERLAESCRRHGLGLGLYYSLWDRALDRDGNDEAYLPALFGQVEELLTQYGELVELWFDGAWFKFRSGFAPGFDWRRDMWRFPGGPREMMRAWREEAAPRWQWDELYALIKRHQPRCMVLNNSTTDFVGIPLLPVDAVTGEQAAEGVPNARTWEWAGQSIVLPQQVEATLSKQGPPGPFAGGSWYWHPWDHSSVGTGTARRWIASAAAQNALLLLNAGVRADGTLRPEDEALLHALQTS